MEMENESVKHTTCCYMACSELDMRNWKLRLGGGYISESETHDEIA